ncbi:beta-phosphoglucomutase [Winogradskyella sp. A3E31]|uniref:beta-phosphoglucomutase n=1 Tax=Winogradskyella sp. A3E31 TaxID=3349637 RepID=UPI00398B1568
MSKTAFIFDLDGVIVDTAKYHFLAWQRLAKRLDIEFTEEENEQLKGVSRVRSLQKILEWGNKTISETEFNDLMASKNEEYLSYIDDMDQSELLPDVLKTLKDLKSKKQPIALGSASKNARRILKQTSINDLFDVIVDGNDVSKAKPDPEVFLNAAKLLNVKPEDCVVFEDSVAGVTAANSANMVSIGIGSKEVLGHADFVFKDFTELPGDFIKELINKKYANKA